MAIVLSGYIIVPEADFEAVVAALPEHVANTHAEPGCIDFSVTADEYVPYRFNVFEKFADRPAFEQHQARVKQSAWGLIARDVVRHYSVRES
ncbi:antibiotic biosynthesis monooxygenase [Gilvimarinus sp. SDUM040013]|uniref:Antibiotic biosynthesis monooxygenase n=1 Tax=Gilvimarinus gilvus TaxID=3058038 RepID=A0ABU4RSM5_9GAMM|nr:antibiotic biosynthesis monooxygenase [Gilvimarinus sp. SDUM040013]MDO3388338.1 antibiotic biosynthesis monooxygenase [Gilvimarinus sp. SDUM040013]MDX6847888.1 antibiotic biosynthesis monooxygenase [Gilvimarinus sp. SDUM040013]